MARTTARAKNGGAKADSKHAGQKDKPELQVVVQTELVIIRPRCPRCSGRRSFVKNSMPWVDGYKVRYHECPECHIKFKSVEKE